MMTTWDTGVFTLQSGEQLILQLVAAALRFERVVIFDQSLALNRPLASFFVGNGGEYERNRRLFEELFNTKIFEVRCQPIENYHNDELAALSDENPIRARGRFVHENGTFEAFSNHPSFDPKDSMFTEFYGWIDPIVAKNRTASSTTQDPSALPLPARVISEFTSILEQRPVVAARELGVPQDKLESFAGLINEPHLAFRRLKDAGLNQPENLAASPRKLINQLAKLPEYRVYQTELLYFGASVFVVVVCSDEKAAGIYNSILREPPYESPDSDFQPEATTHSEAHGFKIKAGIGTALSRAREQKDTRTFLKSPTNSLNSSLIDSAVECYLDEFNREYQRETVIVPIQANLVKVRGITAKFSKVLAKAPHFDHKELLSYALTGIDLSTHALSLISGKSVGVLATLRDSKLKAELRSLLRERCHAVPLSNAPSKTVGA